MLYSLHKIRGGYSDMKKINLLNPNLCKGYLGNGKGEKVEYLEVPEGLTLKALQEDVEIGANAFMAVNYLAGICNEAENICQMENNNEFNMEGMKEVHKNMQARGFFVIKVKC